jgi:hypothetical protein
MKRTRLPLIVGATTLGLAIALSGCGRQTRGSADAHDQSRAASPAEGGATSTQGSAGDSTSFGDTRSKTQQDGVSPSASPTGMSKDVVSPKQPAPPVTPPIEQPKR